MQVEACKKLRKYATDGDNLKAVEKETSHITCSFSPDAGTRGAHEYSQGELVKLTAGYRSLLAARPNGVHLPPWHTGQSRLGLNCISKTIPHVLQT